MSIYDALDTIFGICIGAAVLALAIAAIRVRSDDR